MSDWQVFLDTLARRNAEGWPLVSMPRDFPRRSAYLCKDSESGLVRRDANGPLLRLIDAADRLAFYVPGVGGSVVNPKGPGLRAIGLVTTYARGSQHHKPTLRAADLRKGRPVELRREPDNAYDRNAITLHAPGARKTFGYVQRGRAVSLARRMDQGERLAGICLSGPGPGSDLGTAFLVIGSLDDLLCLARP